MLSDVFMWRLGKILFIKPNYLTHSVTTIIKNAVTFVAYNGTEFLHVTTKLKLSWNRTDRKTSAGNTSRKTYMEKIQVTTTDNIRIVFFFH